MEAFNKLLEENRNFLSEFKNLNAAWMVRSGVGFLKNWSGVSPKLSGKYLNQIINLNRYMFTESSAEDPYDKYSGPLEVSGLISRSILTNECIKQLEGIGLSLFYIDYSTDPEGKVHMHYSKDGAISQFIARCKSNDYHCPPELFDIKDHVQMRLDETSDDLRRVYDELSKEQRRLIRKYTRNTIAYGPCMKDYIEDDKFMLKHTFNHGLMARDVDHVRIVRNEIRKGNIVYCGIVNYYDPFDRNLYEFLAYQFSKQKISQERIGYLVNWIKTTYPPGK